MTKSAPKSSSGPAHDADLALLTHALNDMRDAMVELSLYLLDYLYEHDAVQRDQAAAVVKQAIHTARNRDAKAKGGGATDRHAP